MRYQNVKTGAIFETECECKGADWVCLDPPAPVKEAKRKYTRKKKDGVKDDE